MVEINQKILSILEKLEKQVQTSKKTMIKYRGQNISEASVKTQNNWMKDAVIQYSSLNNILKELVDSLALWSKEELEKP